MKKTVVLMTLFTLLTLAVNAQVAKVYICQNGTMSFFSKTPVEDIDATSQTLNCILNTSTNDINYLVDIASFKFRRPLMQEHFNEKYMETEKYPRATFKGKINEQIDWSKDGIYPVTATGILNIHNVDRSYTEKGTLTIKNGQFTIEGNFNIKPADHNIEIPTIVVSKIAEVINAKHKSTLTPYTPSTK